MPTYEYRCPEGHQFELFQRMSDEPKASCPECGADSERLLSAGAGFLFKGDGFYITDHRSKEYNKEASNDSSGSTMDSASSSDATPLGTGDSEGIGSSGSRPRGGTSSGESSSEKES